MTNPAPDVPLRCRCGQVRGVAVGVSPATGNHVVCYCDDCRAFAVWLDRPDVLDAAGGTDIFQLAPSRLHLTSGDDQLRCVRLSDKGLYRWYTECCHTPIGNMVGARLPFIGLILPLLDVGDDDVTREARLGTPARVMGKFAVGTAPPGTHRGQSLPMIARVGRMMLGWWLRFRHERSPFFDPGSGEPAVLPRVLTPQERRAIGKERRGQAA